MRDYIREGDTIDSVYQKIASRDSMTLAKEILNEELNTFVAKFADYDEENTDEKILVGVGGKRIPYIGWYWRSTDFVGRNIQIGDCGQFIGVMENNKWYNPERALTREEADQVVDIVWEAKILYSKGGLGSEIIANTKAKLNELWSLFQGFKI